MRFFIALFALTLASIAPAAAQITVSSSPHAPFTDAHYIRDDRANLVMTVQREIGFIGFDIDIRGWRDPDGVDRVEYFCQPDSILIVEGSRHSQVYYLPYLVWRRDMVVEPEVAHVESRHIASMGTYQSLLPSSVRARDPPIDMRISTSMRRGDGYVNTLVALTNRSDHTQRLTYVYQDAAYMWFPDGNQNNVESIRISASPAGFERRVNQLSAGPTAPGFWQFVGTFNREHGVVSGMLSFTDGERLGISRYYLGLRGETIDGQGYVHARSAFRRRDIPQVSDGPSNRNQRDGYINRFISLDFGALAPGHTETRAFYRIATVLPENSRTDDGIHDWVVSVVRQISAGS